MRKLIWVVALWGVGMACQHQASSSKGDGITLSGAKNSAATLTATPVPRPLGDRSPTLTPPMRALLRTHDLAPLWRNNGPPQNDNPAIDGPTLDGFFGPDHYRISFVFTRVWRDSLNPALFHVQGKSLYKKDIAPFAGSLEVKHLANLNTRLDLAPDDSTARAYTAESHFVLRESLATKSPGVFEGTGLLDFYVTASGAVEQVLVGRRNTPARGQGLLLKGKWTSNRTKRQKELLLARDVFQIAPDVLEHFDISERGSEINPKYARLGWDDYWENREWWADSTEPSLNL